MQATCKVCGAVLKANRGPGRPAEYCGPVCIKASRRLAHCIGRTAVRGIGRKCLNCGEMFSQFTKSRNHQGIYCSRKCRDEHWAVKPVACPQCGREFVPKIVKKGVRQQHCSRACFHQSIAATPAICRLCGKEFDREGNYRRVYCSMACKGRASRGESSPNWKGGSWQDFKKTFRDYVRVRSAVARGEASFPDGWSIGDPEVQAWLSQYEAARDDAAAAQKAYASESGWPESLDPRSVSILNALAASGIPTKMTDLASILGTRRWNIDQRLRGLRRMGLVSVVRGACPFKTKEDGSGAVQNAPGYMLSAMALSMLERKAHEDKERLQGNGEGV